MTKNKIYAALFPDGKRRFYNQWDDCRKEVTGVSGVKFKGFQEQEDAERWLMDLSGNRDSDIGNKNITIFIDGSYTPKCKRAGWAWVAVKSGIMLTEDYGVTKNSALSRNIDGELEAAVRAINWAVKNKLEVTLHYDYFGIEMWARGKWKVKSLIAQSYMREISPLSPLIKFKKVKGHSGNKWNDRADELAKKGIQEFLEKGKKWK